MKEGANDPEHLVPISACCHQDDRLLGQADRYWLPTMPAPHYSVSAPAHQLASRRTG